MYWVTYFLTKRSCCGIYFWFIRFRFWWILHIPNDVKIECPKQNIIKLTSFNKEKLGAAAAKIRSYRKPEPFKGKGIKYSDEYIYRKEGKKK